MSVSIPFLKHQGWVKCIFVFSHCLLFILLSGVYIITMKFSNYGAASAIRLKIVSKELYDHPEASDRCPSKKWKTQRRKPGEGHRDWSYIWTNQGTPGASRSWKRQGRILPWSLWRERGPTNILILDFQFPEVRE
ncbi:unnamed protein product [Nyctereutes procyonoides]|uniref:(raccoon dog) hypothetical protein n=1 Tax=Nyctereutes procyonoides TaxID=34880 RepID=A0A811Y9H6_NYCPR|nr:unnamed protein product [Nyctereutes procyonoides]